MCIKYNRTPVKSYTYLSLLLRPLNAFFVCRIGVVVAFFAICIFNNSIICLLFWRRITITNTQRTINGGFPSFLFFIYLFVVVVVVVAVENGLELVLVNLNPRHPLYSCHQTLLLPSSLYCHYRHPSVNVVLFFFLFNSFLYLFVSN